MNNDKIKEKLEELVALYEKDIKKRGLKYPDDYDTRSGKKVIKLKREIAELSKGGQEQVVSYYCGNPLTSEDTCQVLAKKNNSCEGCEYRYCNKNK